MSKDKNKLIPKSRFPEFKGGDKWIEKKLGLLTNTTIGEFVIKTKQDPKSPYPVFNGGKSYTGFYDEYNNEANKIVISARGANAGFVNLVKQKYWAGNSCYSVKILEENQINLELLFYYIKHNQRRFTDNQQAANIPSVSKGDVEKFKICYPEEILEQQKIASCLSSLDEVIAAHSQKLELLKDHKKGLMQNLFPQEGETVPKYRFPEFEEDGDWVELFLHDLVKLASGGTPSKEIKEYWGGNFPWISASSMHDLVAEKSELNITNLAIKHGASIAKKGSILILVRGSMLFKRVPICITGREVSFNQDVKSLELKKDVNNTFFLYLLISKESKLLESVTSTGIGAGKLDTEDLKKLGLKVPSNQKEQQKIASCLSSLDELITEETNRIEQLKLHKKGLMQGLFPKIND